ncbi:hypothetical protein D3C85_1764460 [compost metagenome]
MPATPLLMAEEEPKEIKSPKNTDTPLKMSELDPGINGQMTTSIKASSTIRTIL